MIFTFIPVKNYRLLHITYIDYIKSCQNSILDRDWANIGFKKFENKEILALQFLDYINMSCISSFYLNIFYDEFLSFHDMILVNYLILFSDSEEDLKKYKNKIFYFKLIYLNFRRANDKYV